MIKWLLEEVKGKEASILELNKIFRKYNFYKK